MAVHVVGDPVEPNAVPAGERGRLAEAGFIQSGRWAAPGFARVEGRLVVALPKAYVGGLPETEAARTKAAMLLVRVLLRAHREHVGGKLLPGDEPLVTFGLDAPGALQAVEAGLLLRQDFRQNGLYWTRGARLRTNTPGAPVDWSRTMARFAPALTRDGPVFFEPVHRVRARDADDPTHRLHAVVLRRVLTETGEEASVPPTRPLSPGELAELARNPRGLIGRLLGRTYRDRGRRLLHLAGAWLEANRLDVTSTAARPFLLAAPRFEVVWERMLKDVLHDPAEALLVGRGLWTSSTGATRPGIGPQADAIRLWTQTAPRQRFVFDAKDKRVKPRGPSGSEGDHYKQTMYGLLAATAGDVVTNVLLFPDAASGRLVRPLGAHSWPTLTDLPQTQVFEVGVDYERLARSWVGADAIDSDSLFREVVDAVSLLQSTPAPSATPRS